MTLRPRLLLAMILGTQLQGAPMGPWYRLNSLKSNPLRRSTACLGLAALASVFALPLPLRAQDQAWEEVGVASWYGPGFAGRSTASGETYDPQNLTAAHKSLPLGSLVRVHNLENDRDMIVRINDRGPFVRGRVIDLSEAAARVLGFRDHGLTRVRLTHLSGPVTRPVRVAVPPHRGSPAAAPPAESPPTTLDDTAPRNPGETGALVEEAFFDEAVTAATDSGVPADPEGSVDQARYYLQLGAFKDSRRANQLVQTAGPLGMALLVEYNAGMYRVLAGPFESHDAAEQARRDVARAGIDAFVRAEF